MSASADRNLLFGILALQMDFVTRDQLIAAMNAWVLDKAKTLGDILRDQGHLTAERVQLLAGLVNEHVRQHGGDAQRSLAAVSALAPSVQEQLRAIPDVNVQETLGHMDSLRPMPDQPTMGPGATIDRPMPPPAGVRYRILRPHAEGGLGRVSVALDEELHREVALKEIKDRYADNAESRARFVLEAEVTGGLEHPGIVPVYGLGSYEDGRPFYAMRFIRGDSLREAIDRFHKTDKPRARSDFEGVEFRQLLGRFVDVCQAIAYAHSRQVLHRDVKPSNVMLGKYGETLVVDWGVAKPLTRAGPDETTLPPTVDLPFQPASVSGTGETIPGMAVGTPEYMSPEQAAGRSDILGPASDIYSLGATLFAMLTGRAPVAGENMAEILRKVQQGDVTPARKLCPAVPPALEAICRKGMALNPEDRYATALDLARDVEHWLADEPVTAHAEPASVRLRRWGRRHRPLVAGAAALLATAVAGLAIGLVAVERERAQTARAQTNTQAALDALTVEQGKTESALATEKKRRRQTRTALDALVSLVVSDELAKRDVISDDERRFLRQALKQYEEFAADTAADPESQAALARAHMGVGNIRQKLGQTSEAEAAYARGIELYQQLAIAVPESRAYRLALAQSHRSHGYILQRTGRSANAESAYQRAIALQERFVADAPNDPDCQYELSGTLLDYGDLLRQVGRGSDAEKTYRRGLNLMNGPTSDPAAPPTYRYLLARIQIHLGSWLYWGTRRKAEAERFDRRGVELLEGLVDSAGNRPGSAQYREALADGLTELAHALVMGGVGRPAEAVDADRRAMEIREKQVADFPAVPECRHRLAKSLVGLGNHLCDLRRLPEAEPHYRRAIALLESLAHDFPAELVYRESLEDTFDQLGAQYGKAGRREEQERSHRQAVAILERLAADYPGEIMRRNKLARKLHIHGNLLAALGKYSEAEAAYRRAIELWIKLAADDPKSAAYRQGLALSQMMLKDPARSRIMSILAAVRRGDHVNATAEARTLADATDATNVTLYNAACIFSLASAVPKDDPALDDRYATRAVELLRQAIAKGYADIPHLLADADLAPLRGRADYADLLWDIADSSAAPVKP